eukprot:13372769-Ditylum_brightwellii.AAC.1
MLGRNFIFAKRADVIIFGDLLTLIYGYPSLFRNKNATAVRKKISHYSRLPPFAPRYSHTFNATLQSISPSSKYHLSAN